MQTLTQTKPDLTNDKKAVALRAFFNIAEKWGLTNGDMITLLGQPTEATLYNWKKGQVKTVSYDTIQRVSYILGIYKALQHLYIRPELADAWIKKPNLQFGGDSALNRMLGGDIIDLASVRTYLDNVRGGR